MTLDQTGNELPWGVRKRLELIEFKLFWEGRVNRGDLQNSFKISVPQASADLAKYIEIAPNNLAYDRKGKFYSRTETFEPVLLKISSDHYLSQLHAISMNLIDSNSTGISNVPPIGHAPIPPRIVDPYVLRSVTAAITSNLKLEINYQSMNSEEPENRWISPHALAFDDFRWHVRALCHKDSSYKDFVLGRIISTGRSEPNRIDPGNDSGWNNSITLEIIPNPKLKESQRKIIELDYGMNKGKLEINCRIALAKYVLKTYGLDKDTDEMPANAQHIILSNRSGVLAALNNRLTF